MLQGASPAKQRSPNPPEEVLEDPFVAGRLSPPHPDEQGMLGLPQHLPLALLLKN